MPSATSTDAATRLKEWHENFVEAITSVARVIPVGQVYQSGGVRIVRSGLAIPAFNCVFALDPPRTLEGIDGPIEQILVRGGIPWHLVTTAETSDLLAPVIRSFRLKHRGVLPGMVWEPLPELAPPSPEGLEIRRVRETKDARTFSRTMMEGFGVPSGLMDLWAEGLAAGGPRLSITGGLYVGYVGDRPVCTAMRFTSHDVAGIYGVSTLAEYRRRGFGAAITYRAAVDGREEGCRMSYLQSSTIGRPVYEKIGYRFVEEYHLWAPEASSPA